MFWNVLFCIFVCWGCWDCSHRKEMWTTASTCLGHGLGVGDDLRDGRRSLDHRLALTEPLAASPLLQQHPDVLHEVRREQVQKARVAEPRVRAHRNRHLLLSHQVDHPRPPHGELRHRDEEVVGGEAADAQVAVATGARSPERLAVQSALYTSYKGRLRASEPDDESGDDDAREYCDPASEFLDPLEASIVESEPPELTRA